MKMLRAVSFGRAREVETGLVISAGASIIAFHTAVASDCAVVAHRSSSARLQ
jgi:hypothetical protein